MRVSSNDLSKTIILMAISRMQDTGENRFKSNELKDDGVLHDLIA